MGDEPDPDRTVVLRRSDVRRKLEALGIPLPDAQRAAERDSSRAPTELARRPPATPASDPAAESVDEYELTREDLGHIHVDIEVLRPLGEGGMARVYEVRNRRTGIRLALKLIAPQFADDAMFVARFEREARALEALSHPNIVGLRGFGVTRRRMWLLMELVDGISLADRLDDLAGPLPLDHVAAIGAEVCDALAHAHAHGLVHRDVKPANVLLDPTGNVKLADFGVAKLLRQSHGDMPLTKTGDVIGTPAYMAPEQLRGARDVDGRLDVYAVGIMLHEMATGEVPKMSTRPRALGSRLDALIAAATSVLPAGRPTAEELAARLRRLR